MPGGVLTHLIPPVLNTTEFGVEQMLTLVTIILILIYLSTKILVNITIERSDKKVFTLEYNGVNRVVHEGQHYCIYLDDKYKCNGRELLQELNCSTVPYVHVFYDVVAISIYECCEC